MSIIPSKRRRARVTPDQEAIDGSLLGISPSLRTLLCEPSREEGVSTVGSLIFPVSNHLAAHWARVKVSKGSDASLELAKEQLTGKGGLFDIWKMGRPSVVINVSGAAATLELPKALDSDIREGLAQAVAKTQAWVTTGGTDSGVMHLVGRALRNLPEQVPLIGFAPWRMVGGHDQLADDTARRMGATTTYEVGRDESAHNQARLEPNHTHFILVDDTEAGSVSWGSEIALQNSVQEALCPFNTQTDELIAVPRVCVVIGGNAGSLNTAAASLREGRPVVVLPESGGAAAAIYAVCFEEVEMGALLAELGWKSELAGTLREIQQMHAKYRGTLDQAVSVYKSGGSTPSLKGVILDALLDGMRHNSTDALRLAVQATPPGLRVHPLASGRLVHPLASIPSVSPHRRSSSRAQWKDRLILRSELEEMQLEAAKAVGSRSVPPLQA